MASVPIRVWLPAPDSAELMGGLPDRMAADVWTGGEQVPDSAGEVEVLVMPFGVRRSRLSLLAALPRLRLIQLMSAGAERVIPHVPAGVTLCNARGAPDAAVAEWIVAVILAQVRGLPGFLAAQQRGAWEFTEVPSLAGQTVLIVGYGSIGEAAERVLTPFGVTVERVARHARPGVAGVDDLPAMLPRADVVVLLVPVTPATVALADARFLGLMRDGALLVNAARGQIVDTAALLAELQSGPPRACCSRPTWPGRPRRPSRAP
jgi:phosphoglycerate dehydrogenase-like enzyme